MLEKYKKYQKLLEYGQVIHYFKALDLEIPICCIFCDIHKFYKNMGGNKFREIFKVLIFRKIKYFAKQTMY